MTKAIDHRSALARARFFLLKARKCSVSSLEQYEAFIDASIIFTRAALHRFRGKWDSHADFAAWWKELLADESVKFFGKHRNLILKEAPAKIGQRIVVGGNAESFADDLYFFNPNESACDSLENFLVQLEASLTAANDKFLGLEPFADDIPIGGTAGGPTIAQGVESARLLKEKKKAAGDECFYCSGRGQINTGYSCSRCGGLGYFG